MEKTITLEFLDNHNINYEFHSYEDSGAVRGNEVAAAIGKDANRLFKTVVMKGRSEEVYVFLIPAMEKLAQRKTAQYLGEKALEMVNGRELEPLTGYTHGGCSPIATKNKFRTVIDASALECDTILINGGKIGYLVELTLEELKKVLDYEVADLRK
ncbi:Cys-tRNA(Pro)/Cys-tRNA(Cys) deacylase [Lachnospiraceae bacterium PF1-22]|uniref:aminoacyl-tRNA deacylase n=1 Tax=Ohessyouella blattaphilus TaxID=2949333 RepID=UPI003E1C0576